MKPLHLIIYFAFCISCDNNPNNSAKQKSANPELKLTVQDSYIAFNYQLDIKDSLITNNSKEKIDLLFNGMSEFLSGTRGTVNFNTECMMCEPIQKFDHALLFAKRLLITPDNILFYKEDRKINDSIDQIKLVRYYGERAKLNFTFTG